VAPILLPEILNPKEFARRLLIDHGIWASAIWFIAKPRIRTTVNVLHTREEMDTLVAAMVKVRDEMMAEVKPELSLAM
jgi:glycine C-acetyltransferase